MNNLRERSLISPYTTDQSISSALVLRTLLNLKTVGYLENVAFDRMIFPYLFLIRLSGLSLPQFEMIDLLVYGNNTSHHMASFVSKSVKNGYLRKSATDSPGCSGKTYLLTDKGIDKIVEILQKILKFLKECDMTTGKLGKQPVEHNSILSSGEDTKLDDSQDKIVALPLFPAYDNASSSDNCGISHVTLSDSTIHAAYKIFTKLNAELLKSEHKLILRELKSRHTYEIYNMYIRLTLMPYSEMLQNLVYEKPFHTGYSQTKKQGDLFPDLSFWNNNMNIRYCIEIDMNSERSSVLFQKQLRYYKFMSFNYRQNASDVFYGFYCPKERKVNTALPENIEKLLLSSRLPSMLFAIQVYQASSNHEELINMIRDIENAALKIHDQMESHFQSLMLLIKFVYNHVTSDLNYIASDIQDDFDHVQIHQLRAAILYLKHLVTDYVSLSDSQCPDAVISKQKNIFSYYLLNEHLQKLLRIHDCTFHPIWNGLSITAAELYDLSDSLPFYAPEFAFGSDAFKNRFLTLIGVEGEKANTFIRNSAYEVQRCIKVPFEEDVQLYYDLPAELQEFILGPFNTHAALHMRLGISDGNTVIYIENVSADLAGLIRFLTLLEMKDRLRNPVYVILLVRDSIYTTADLFCSYFPYEYHGELENPEYTYFYSLYHNAEEILANHPIHNMYEFNASDFLHIKYIKQSCFNDLCENT